MPGLLSLPYLGCCRQDDPVYQATREGLNMIWPMAIIAQALTSTDESEIRQRLRWLKTTHAGTGFMHESFDKDNPARFTRAWFAWANSLFGELIIKLSQERPGLLRKD